MLLNVYTSKVDRLIDKNYISITVITLITVITKKTQNKQNLRAASTLKIVK